MFVPKYENFEYVFKELPNHVDLKFNCGIRILEVVGSKINKLITNHVPVSLNCAGSFIAEEIHPEEASKETGDRIINVAHAWSEGKQPLKYFGNPFRCLSKKVNLHKALQRF